ncbi:BRCT domain-containing protein [Hydrogenophaga sp.]|uniref:BRCT domain-containing protein n=1 Tax=Hydrogenophaga sp. TaxID=1904254 RepID=UPI003F71FA67
MIDDTNAAAIAAVRQRQLNRSMEMLMGMVTAMVADAHLHDLEIKLLSTWLEENAALIDRWPASVIARKVKEVMTDGVITEAERDHLQSVLLSLATTNFAETGSSSPEVTALPVTDHIDVRIRDAGVCHTGVFLYGTRAACERLTELAGGLPQSAVTGRTAYLVVGSQVSPNWIHTSFGRKLQKAAEMRDGGHPLGIITERKWLAVVGG